MSAAVARGRELVGQLRTAVSANPASAKDLLVKFKVRRVNSAHTVLQPVRALVQQFRTLHSILWIFPLQNAVSCRLHLQNFRSSPQEQRHLPRKRPSRGKGSNMESSCARSWATQRASSGTFKC